MYGIRRIRHSISLSKRQLSSTAAEHSGPEQRAKEVGGGLAKWFKKYAIILVPGTFMTILTVDVINNVNHRNAIEKLAPMYIDFVRQRYGFDDEDFPEKKRLEFLDNFYNNEFKLRIRLRDGSSKEVTVSGRQHVTDLATSASSNSFVGQTQIFCSDMLEVEDSPVNSETYTIGDKSPTLESMLGPRNNSEEFPSSSLSSLSSSATTASTGTSVDGFLNSQWTPHLSADYRDALGLRYRFYENYVFNPYACIQAYLAMGTPGLFPFSYGHPQQQQRAVASISQPSQQKNSSSTATKAQQASSPSNADRLQAQRDVENLEKEIKKLEEEKMMGFRDMDTVNEEIKLKRQEITRIKRQYLSGFFSFW